MSGKPTVMRSGEGLGGSRTDWKRLERLGDAEIVAAVRDDPDAVDPGETRLRHAILPGPARPKERVTMRLDADMVHWFRGQGRGYQTRMNAVLRAFFEAHQPASGEK
jgi:uncharacterized protein (DUF4415 family)